MEYQALLKSDAVRISVSGKGDRCDNAMVETFFMTMKSEFVWRRVFDTRTDAATMIGGYIDRFYNATRASHHWLSYVPTNMK